MDALKIKIQSMNWLDTAKDVKKFLPRNLLHSADKWDADLFLALLEKY